MPVSPTFNPHRNINEHGCRSRKICDTIKSVRKESVKSLFKHFDTSTKQLFEPFLNKTVTLVPVPRRACSVLGGLWPSNEGFSMWAATVCSQQKGWVEFPAFLYRTSRGMRKLTF